jgi:hypothetical protein
MKRLALPRVIAANAAAPRCTASAALDLRFFFRFTLLYYPTFLERQGLSTYNIQQGLPGQKLEGLAERDENIRLLGE